MVGSQVYGLATPESDCDYLAVAAVETIDLVGLSRPPESWVSKDPDSTVHEAGKFCRLALPANPTILELLWLPEDAYTFKNVLGAELIAIRRTFLSRKRVRDAYLGYAIQQFKPIENRGDSFSSDTKKRTAK